MKAAPILILSLSVVLFEGCATTDKVVWDGPKLAPSTNVATVAAAKESDQRTMADLVGHWESVAMNGPTVSSDVTKMEFDLYGNNELLATTFSTHAEPFQQTGSYSVEGNRLIIVSADARLDAATCSLVGDHLIITFGQNNVILLRTNKSPGQR